MKKIAFTLAEVLIVLGVIGVVAEMTIPTLMQEFQQQVLKTQFKSTYSTISNALTMMKANLGDYPACNYGENGSWAECPKFFDELEKTLKLTKTCKGNAYSEGCIPLYLGDDKASCGGFNQTYVSNYNTAYVLSDGTIIEPYSQSYGALIMVDINGKDKPNKWGYDVFDFLFNKVNGDLRLQGGGCFNPELGGKTTSQMWNESFR